MVIHSKKKREAFVGILDKLCEISALNAIVEIETNRSLSEVRRQDIRFYKDQQGALQLATMSVNDRPSARLTAVDLRIIS